MCSFLTFGNLIFASINEERISHEDFAAEGIEFRVTQEEYQGENVYVISIFTFPRDDGWSLYAVNFYLLENERQASVLPIVFSPWGGGFTVRHLKLSREDLGRSEISLFYEYDGGPPGLLVKTFHMVEVLAYYKETAKISEGMKVGDGNIVIFPKVLAERFNSGDLCWTLSEDEITPVEQQILPFLAARTADRKSSWNPKEPALFNKFEEEFDKSWRQYCGCYENGMPVIKVTGFESYRSRWKEMGVYPKDKKSGELYYTVRYVPSADRIVALSLSDGSAGYTFMDPVEQ